MEWPEWLSDYQELLKTMLSSWNLGQFSKTEKQNVWTLLIYFPFLRQKLFKIVYKFGSNSVVTPTLYVIVLGWPQNIGKCTVCPPPPPYPPQNKIIQPY